MLLLEPRTLCFAFHAFHSVPMLSLGLCASLFEVWSQRFNLYADAFVRIRRFALHALAALPSMLCPPCLAFRALPSMLGPPRFSLYADAFARTLCFAL
jgi:hypothetical protein